MTKSRQTRRRVLGGAAAGVGSLLLPQTWLDAAQAPAPRALVVPPWDAVPDCTPSRTDSARQGPFFIHDGDREDDASLFRQDIRGRHNMDAEAGTEMQLHLRVLRASGEATCGKGDPLQGIEVYIWHVDAQGFYSGFGEPGEQKPDEPYRFRPGPDDLDNTDRFCRGAGVSDANGVVSFRSIFPGWYNGRDVHIHAMLLKRGSKGTRARQYRGGEHVFTTQLYFQPELIDRVHRASEPYLRRTGHAAYPGLILGDERGASNLRMKASFADGVVVSQMQLLVDPEQSRV
jgi:protocatechuate 3,4-dioxygenase beta subunit